MRVEHSIPASLAVLGRYFPVGYDAARSRLYEDDLRRHQCHPLDVAEAVERLKASRESRTFPQIGLVLRHVRESRTHRLMDGREGPALTSGEGLVKLGPFHAEEMRVWRALAVRGLTYCDVLGLWLEDEHCSHEPICYGARVSIQEASEKLSWAEENRPINPRRQAYFASARIGGAS